MLFINFKNSELMLTGNLGGFIIKAKTQGPTVDDVNNINLFVLISMIEKQIAKRMCVSARFSDCKNTLASLMQIWKG